jgi:hypothetical protein
MDILVPVFLESLNQFETLPFFGYFVIIPDHPTPLFISFPPPVTDHTVVYGIEAICAIGDVAEFFRGAVIRSRLQ